jgi:hypothetical protein
MIAIQAAASADGFGRGGADMIRGSFSTSPPLRSKARRSGLAVRRFLHSLTERFATDYN